METRCSLAVKAAAYDTVKVKLTVKLVNEALESFENRRVKNPKLYGPEDRAAYVTGYLQAGLHIGEEDWS